MIGGGDDETKQASNDNVDKIKARTSPGRQDRGKKDYRPKQGRTSELRQSPAIHIWTARTIDSLTAERRGRMS